MKFRYYIADVMNGIVVGTDSREVAEDWAGLESDAFVVDTAEGNWLMLSGQEILDVEIEEAKPDDLGTEEEQEENDDLDSADDPNDSRN